jgi:hypothetical protein
MKNIMALSSMNPSYIFTAELLNGTIFLRELHPASANPQNSQSLAGAVFESVMLKGKDKFLSISSAL